MIDLEAPITILAGVGKVREKQLNKLKIFTLRDLIYFFPRRYENRGKIIPISEISYEAPVATILTVATEPTEATLKRGLKITKFRAFDESGSAEIVFFNSPHVKAIFHTGDTFRFYGKAEITRKKIQLVNPKFDPFIDGTPLPDYYPVYPLTEGISSKIIDKLVMQALEFATPQIIDYLPDKIRIENELPTLCFALTNIHSPSSEESLKKAIRRLSFDELFIFGLGVSISASSRQDSQGVRFLPCNMSEFVDFLPYELTGDQKKAINDIYSDTVIKTKHEGGGQMARILVGDVGCGKTVCAAAAIYIAAKSGFQSALMAPTEILANQHYNELKKMFTSFGENVELLTGSVSKKEKARIYNAIENGSTKVIVGTHALLSEKLNFSNLGLVITDEQHRFGVIQRAILKNKSKSAHMLVMSATPIPRTLALTMYGDLDVSKISEMPKGRQRVDTFVISDSYRERLNEFIRKQIALGGQCYVVCPAIEKDEANDEQDNAFQRLSSSAFANVEECLENMRQNFGDIKIEGLHGKIKASEKDEIMRRFANGETKILVSTTVIEVGVNVPNASLMIIENADRFGLSQLHQLRGRVGRGTRKSYCVLISYLKSEKAKERLEIMRTTYDGFEIANKDLAIRGPGDFFASAGGDSMRQSGGFDFKLAKLCEDESLLSAAFSAAKTVVSSDRHLTSPENSALKRELYRYIEPINSTIS